MKLLSHRVLALIVTITLSASAVAVPQRDAGSKARGDIYHFWNARSQQSHAQNQVQSLYHYGQTQGVVAAAPAQEHVASVRQGLEASRKSVAELKKSNPDNKDAQAAIARLEEIHKKVLEQCDHVEKELAKGEADSVTICACCVDMHHDLDTASAEMKKLKKALKIEDPKIPAKEGK